MRVGLDLTVAGTRGGISTYALRLLDALGRVAPEHDLVLWCGSKASAAVVRPLAPSNARLVIPGPIVRGLGAWGRVGLMSPLALGDLVGSVGVFHALNYFPPARRGDAPLVITVHDLSALRHPEWHPPHRAVLHRLALRRVARSATHVITVTEAVRAEVIDRLGVPPARVTAVPHAAAKPFRLYDAAELQPALDRHRLRPQGYLCFVGALEPRKNLPRLLEAVSRLRARRPDTPPLVLAGPPGWRHAELRARLAGPGVRYLGYLPPAELAPLVAGSAAFVYPSLYEGFGLPVLEALACGAPVVTSAGGALAEVAGDSAVLVDPTDVEAIGAGIERVLDDGGLRADLARRGPERARRFSWERAARETLGVYERCAAEAAGSGKNPPSALPRRP